MPLIPITVELAGDPTSSERDRTQGLLELVDIKYDGAPAVEVAIDLCVDDDGSTQTYTEIWRSPSTNTAAFYLPVKVATLPDGTEAGGESHIPIRSRHGWRLRVIGGASTGSVSVYVGIEQ